MAFSDVVERVDADVSTGADIGTSGKPGRDTIDVLDVLITAAGDLEILVNSLAPPKDSPSFHFDYGHERQRQMQDALDSI